VNVYKQNVHTVNVYQGYVHQLNNKKVNSFSVVKIKLSDIFFCTENTPSITTGNTTSTPVRTTRHYGLECIYMYIYTVYSIYICIYSVYKLPWAGGQRAGLMFLLVTSWCSFGFNVLLGWGGVRRGWGGGGGRL
jgi:hypothetical protein